MTAPTVPKELFSYDACLGFGRWSSAGPEARRGGGALADPEGGAPDKTMMPVWSFALG